MEQKTLETMLAVSRQMAEIRAFDPLLEHTLQEAATFVHAENGYIILLGADNTFEFRTQLSHTGQPIQNPQDQVSMSIINKALFEGEAVLTHDAIHDPDFESAESVRELMLRSVLCVPLISQGEILGAIFLENRSMTGLFKQDDLALLTLFANQAAVNVANARLNDELEARVVERTYELETALAELKEAQAQIERGWQDAVELNRLQAILMGNIAHDLRSPLAIAIGTLTLLQEGAFGEVTDEQNDWINNCLKALNLATRLTTDIFDMVKLEQGKIALEKQAVDLEEFLYEIHKIGRGLSWEEGVAFNLDIPNKLPTISADPIRIQQVLLNLLANSLKYTHQGSVTLFARWQPENNLIHIGVQDTGDGIEEYMVGKIFERFQQSEVNQVSRRQGAGLGLAICKELIEMHGGKIWAESEIGKGTLLQFTLPTH